MFLRNEKLNNDSVPEECGVIGIFSKEKSDVGKKAYYGLYALQHRGEQSAGISVASDKKFFTVKGNGYVSDVFVDNALDQAGLSHIAVGHVRYSAGSGVIQPFTLTGRQGAMSLAFNGKINNASQLRHELVQDGIIFQSAADIEVVAALVNKYSSEGLKDGLYKACSLLSGAFCIVLATVTELLVVRDACGIRPLSIGETPDGTMVIASESCALSAVKATFLRDIEPGEIFTVSQKGHESVYLQKKKESVCLFEYVYFARPDSVIDGCSVYKTRKAAGEILAKKYPIDADIVSGVPDGATVAAEAYAEVSGIPFTEVLAKNRYIGRTFIEPDSRARTDGVDIKLKALQYNVEGKRIVLLDDSVVTGTTAKRIVSELYEAGAKEVHLRICSPEIKYHCFYGIDSGSEKLLCSGRTKEEIARELKCASIEFLSLDDLKECCADMKRGCCSACFDGRYPMEITVKINIETEKEKYGNIL